MSKEENDKMFDSIVASPVVLVRNCSSLKQSFDEELSAKEKEKKKVKKTVGPKKKRLQGNID